MSENSRGDKFPTAIDVKQSFEANGAKFHDFRPVREGVVAAVFEPRFGGLDGCIFVLGKNPPDITKRQSMLGRDLGVTFSLPVALNGFEDASNVTAIYVDCYVTYNSKNKAERVQYLKDDCDAFISDIENIGLLELE